MMGWRVRGRARIRGGGGGGDDEGRKDKRMNGKKKRGLELLSKQVSEQAGNEVSKEVFS